MYITGIYHILMCIPIILLYHFYGLMWSTVASIAGVALLIVGLKAARKKVEPLLYAELGFMLLFGLPGIFMQSGLLLKLSEPISGLVAGISFGIASLIVKTPFIKLLIPQEIKESPRGKAWLEKLPDKPLKKIEYIWAIEMTLSAALSLAAVFVFPTNIWFYAKYIIGPVLSTFAFIASGYTLYSYFRRRPLTQDTYGYYSTHGVPQVDEAQKASYQNHMQLFLRNGIVTQSNNKGADDCALDLEFNQKATI